MADGYKLVNDTNGNICTIMNLATGQTFGINSDNRDYMAYLAWVAAGNTPTPADAPMPQAMSPAEILAAALVAKGLISPDEINAVAEENGVVFYQTPTE